MTLTLPKTLVAGTNENVNDVMSNDTYLAAQVDATNTTAEYAYSKYKTIIGWMGGGCSTAITSSLALNANSAESSIVPGDIFYLDPADYTAGTRTTKYHLRTFLAPNQVAPAITFTFGLYPVTVSAAASGSVNTYAFGSVVSGSTVSFVNPIASTVAANDSADFTAPAAGVYALGVAVSGSAAAGNRMDLRACLQMRQV